MTTIRAHVRNGQIVPDEPVELPEGMAVTVYLKPDEVEETESRTGTPLDGLEEFIGAFGDLPPDASTSYEEELRREANRR